VYGPVRTVVWQGSAGDRRPYADRPTPPSFTVDLQVEVRVEKHVLYANTPGGNDTRLTILKCEVDSAEQCSRQ
jgi:hypothetical protein